MTLADIAPAWAPYLCAALFMACMCWCGWRHSQATQTWRQTWQQREQQKQALLRQAQAHTRLVDEVVMAMRQPMQGVLELNGTMREREDLSPQVRLYLKHAHDAVVHLQTVVNDLLDPMHNAADEGVLSLRVSLAPCEVRRVVQEAFDLFETRCGQMGLTYLCDIDQDVPKHLITDGQRLRQVLINLLGNAVKFTHTGHICLRVTTRAQHLRFSVEDTGIGIADQQQARIFKRFTQADEGIRDRYGGHGLGLAISSQVVAQLGGALRVHSVLGQGACFEFDLPLKPGLTAA